MFEKATCACIEDERLRRKLLHSELSNSFDADAAIRKRVGKFAGHRYSIKTGGAEEYFRFRKGTGKFRDPEPQGEAT